jgi:hypothetical protein
MHGDLFDLLIIGVYEQVNHYGLASNYTASAYLSFVPWATSSISHPWQSQPSGPS